jgi:hypothetical protein
MATGTDKLAAAPYPDGLVEIKLGPCSFTGDTSGFKTLAMARIPFRCKIISGTMFVTTATATTDCDVKIVDDKDTPQTPVASFAAESLDDGARHALTIASSLTDSLPGETLALQFDGSNAADVVENLEVTLLVKPIYMSPQR